MTLLLFMSQMVLTCGTFTERDKLLTSRHNKNSSLVSQTEGHLILFKIHNIMCEVGILARKCSVFSPNERQVFAYFLMYSSSHIFFSDSNFSGPFSFFKVQMLSLYSGQACPKALPSSNWIIKVTLYFNRNKFSQLPLLASF